MNINQALEQNKIKLKKKQVDNVDFEAGSILALALGKTREFLFTHPEFKLNPFHIMKNKLLLLRRIGKTPLAYLTGDKEFFGLDFFVNRHVLIPRPETELMVNEALRIARSENIKTFIDIGTGSGCIMITLAKKVAQAVFWGLDISSSALAMAKKNAKRHKVSVKFIRSNLLRELIGKKLEPKIMILANLPYLTPKQVKDSPSIKKEPKLALLGGDDGLEYYHLLFKQIRISRFPRPLYMLCEIDESQKKKISELIEAEFPTGKYEIKKDLAGFDRLVIIKLAGPKKDYQPNIGSRNLSQHLV